MHTMLQTENAQLRENVTMECNNTYNRLCLSGWIQDVPSFSHSLYGEAFYSFYLIAPRLSGAEDILPVTISERLLIRLPGVGEAVEIDGQLRSYNRHLNGTNRLIVTVFARAVVPKAQTAPFINEIVLTGYICKPPVYRTTPFQREITDLLVAVNRPYHKSDYLPVITWGRNAHVANDLEVGTCVRITGRVQSRSYQKLLPSGETITRIAYEVSANSVERMRSQLEPFEREL